jgi:diguanylate cyclase (GGDEF)-like protein
MFREIYAKTWENDSNKIYLRLVEELSELAEAVRFNHLYPKNFENELADFFAWWFAISNLIVNSDGTSKDIEQLLWESYPAQCLDCSSMPCFCPPRPVRELMSKPAPGQFDKVDPLTSLHNQGAYNSDIDEVKEKRLAMAFPIACVRIDVDDFKRVNDDYGHSAGDEALKHIAAVLRKKARIRDRLYRVGGDEFGAMLIDYTEEEAFGLMRRVAATLQRSPVRWVGSDGTTVEFIVTTSIGVAECSECSDVKTVFESADKAAYASKRAGKNTITKATSLP